MNVDLMAGTSRRPRTKAVPTSEGGLVLWLTGLSAAGKTTLARLLEAEFLDRGRLVEVLDGDVVRTHLSKGLGYSREDRDTNIQRIAWVASRLARAGAVVIVAAISPYAEARGAARNLIEAQAPFLEIYIAASVETCAERDVKGLYERAFRGEISDFTGVSAPYEEPTSPDVRVDSGELGPGACAELVMAVVRDRRLSD
jgi:adenylyl-sulfate kinase